MISWLLALAVAIGGALMAYPLRQWRAQGTPRRWTMLLALARGAAVGLVAALILGAPRAPATPLPPVVVVDASASWRRAAPDPQTVPARVARFADSVRDEAATLGGVGAPAPEVLWVGDSLRAPASTPSGFAANDAGSRVRPAVDLANATGRSLWLVTDGEVDDPEALEEAPPGSRWIVPPVTPRADVAVAEVGIPAEALGGDTVTVDAEVVAGGAGGTAGELHWLLDGRGVVASPTPALGPWGSARVTARLPLPRGARMAVVAAALSVAGDLEPRNDTLRAALSISDRPAVVLVSTAPDLDVREALRILRGTLRVPTQAYLRLAPGTWRVEGTLAPITEAAVREQVRAAAVLIVHGDTAWATPGAGGVRAARALWRPAPAAPLPRAGEGAPSGEWFAAPPAAPWRGGSDATALEAALAGLPFDSLPPLVLPAASDSAAAGGMGQPLLVGRLARRGTGRPLVMASLREGRREVRIDGSGYAGWAMRGGRPADAFTALWGAVFDWLAAGRGDSRAAVPARPAIREGEPIRWRRGGSDSTVAVRLSPRGGAEAMSLTLRFGAEGRELVTPPRPEGVTDVEVPGGRALLVVNPAREWVPRPPRTPAMPPGGVLRPAEPPRLVDAGWPFVLVLLLLSAEWIGRRFAGYR